MLFIPYRADVAITRWPIANFVLLALIVLCFGAQLSAPAGIAALEPFILTDWSASGLIGHIFLHGGVMHLVGNMIFLWVFGNAVCGKVGNVAYPFVFLGLGVFAGAMHLLFKGGAAVGASGAINGVVGMFLVWFPLNTISMLYFVWLLFIIRVGTFELSSYWLILLWLAFDILGASLDLPSVAYWAHLGGFAAGFCLAALLTKLGWVETDEEDRTLLDIIGLGQTRRAAPVAALDAYRAAAREAAEAAAHRSHTARGPLREPFPPRRTAAAHGPAPPRIKILCMCGKLLQVNAVHAGKVGRCPACGATVRIPDA